MAGVKTFTNGTGKNLEVTLYIRAGADPANNAGTQSFSLGGSESKQITYGDNTNIYLNGFSVMALYNGQITAEQEFVVRRGSNLDDQLNKNNHITILFSNNSFQISASN